MDSRSSLSRPCPDVVTKSLTPSLDGSRRRRFMLQRRLHALRTIFLHGFDVVHVLDIWYVTLYLLQKVAKEVQDMNWGTFKPVLTDALIDHLQPIQVIRGLEREENLKWPDYNSLGAVAAINHIDFQG
ncbi:hypothetical protein Tco_0614679 [Tanacetum coccineum]